MKRTNLYLTEKQVERLKQRSEQEGLSLRGISETGY